MIPTLPFLRETFDRFNLLCFQGSLPSVTLQLGRSRRTIGLFSCRNRTPLLRFSTQWDLPVEVWEDTVIHEMIHLAIWHSGKRDSSAHGRLFRQWMADINATHGRHITISHRCTPEEREAMVDTRRRLHVVALVFFKDGRTGLKLLPQKAESIARYHRGLKLSGRVTRIEFFLSLDPWFNRFPTSSALNVIFRDEAEVRSHLTDATPI